MNFLEICNHQKLKKEKDLLTSKSLTKSLKAIKDPTICKKICEEYYTTSVSELTRKYNIGRKGILGILKRNNIPKKERENFNSLPIDVDYFKNIDSSDKSYFLGFITGDGHIRRKHASGLSVSIDLALKDIEVLEKFKYFIKSEHKIQTFERISHLKKERLLKGCRIWIGKRDFVKHIINHGIGPDKSKSVKLPNTIPKELMCHYFRGLLDSDGFWSISKNGKISFGILSSVYSFLEECKEYLQKECFVGNPSIIAKEGCYVLTFGGKSQCNRLYKYLYFSGGPRLERKYITASKYFQYITDDEIKECIKNNDFYKNISNSDVIDVIDTK